MKLFLIHGRAQEGKNPEELKSFWMDALKKGLKKNDLVFPNDVEVIFPYYGDLLNESVLAQGSNIENLLERGNGSNLNLDFFNNFLMDLSSNAEINESNIIKNYDGNLKERGPLNWEWVHAILKSLDKTPIGDISIKKFTYDAFLYLTIPGIRSKINNYIVSKLDNEPCVVVAHSLGSAIAYNVLRNSKNMNVVKFITLGSPLGLRSFKSRLETPILMPPCISNGWYNAYDERDVVALRPLNKATFDIVPEIENINSIDNFTKNRHGIEGYISDKIVSRKIYDSLIKIT